MRINSLVDLKNETELAKLPGPEMHFNSVYDGEDAYRAQAWSLVNAESKLRLRVGAPVVLLRNLDSERKLYNGANGTCTRTKLWTLRVQHSDTNLMGL